MKKIVYGVYFAQIGCIPDSSEFYATKSEAIATMREYIADCQWQELESAIDSIKRQIEAIEAVQTKSADDKRYLAELTRQLNRLNRLTKLPNDLTAITGNAIDGYDLPSINRYWFEPIYTADILMLNGLSADDVKTTNDLMQWLNLHS